MATFSNKLNKEETFIACSILRSGDHKMWDCELCMARFETIVEAIVHIWSRCPASKIASPRAIIPKESIAKICARLDPGGSKSLLETWRYFQGQYGDDGVDEDGTEESGRKAGQLLAADAAKRHGFSDIADKNTLISRRTPIGEHTSHVAENFVALRTNTEQFGGNPKAEANPEREFSDFEENGDEDEDEDEHPPIWVDKLGYSPKPPAHLDTEEEDQWTTMETRISQLLNPRIDSSLTIKQGLPPSPM